MNYEFTTIKSASRTPYGDGATVTITNPYYTHGHIQHVDATITLSESQRLELIKQLTDIPEPAWTKAKVIRTSEGWTFVRLRGTSDAWLSEAGTETSTSSILDSGLDVHIID